MGRSDHQVKIRGFRVELFEIEAALNQHPGVQTGVVLAKEDALGNQELVAYVLPDAQASTHRDSERLIATLRTDLKASLPHYMVPAFFMTLDEMPLTPSGKVDRKALATLNPDQQKPVAEHADNGQDPRYLSVEQEVNRIWQEVLKQPDIALRDNFFELGGNSLLAAQLVGIAQEAFDIVLPIRCVYEEPTVEGLSNTIQTIQHSGGDPLAVLTDVGSEPVPLPPLARTNQPILPDLANPKAIFLTGATGFLGAFLLYELLQQTDATVYCLVRAATHGEGLTRLRSTFAKYSLPVSL
ncbi:MAG: non-ribosomal peptide synthetase, partial [Moorea sp. SIO3C2]|nr:non-ribosomal peptide synthetase [Moorena sp. SIO3C2]